MRLPIAFRLPSVTVGLAALLLLLPPLVSAEAPGTGAAPIVKAQPFVEDHITRGGLQNPPDTAFCKQNLGIACYRPAQIQKAYNMQPLFSAGLNGTGRTIVIVDAFGSPTIKHDLQVFDQTFGVPDPPALDILQPVGAIPAFDPNAFNGDEVSWAEETSLDVEWSHVMAPGARILLVETPVDETEGVQGFPEIVAAENYVVDHNLGDVISQSFGATEQTFPDRRAILNLRSAFKNARDHHVTVLGSSGDTGATNLELDQSCCYATRVNSWPSADPLVTSVGGTQLHLDAAGNRTAPDNVWNDFCAVSAADCIGASGGGLSSIFARPEFQDRVHGVVGERRGTPDVSLSAAVDGGVVAYFTFIAPTSPWHVFGGTSEASPLFAGVVAIADQAAGHRLGWLNPRLYRLGDPAMVDITRGSNTFIFCATNCGAAQETDTTVTGFNAQPGYDLASGLGTVNATKLVRSIAGDRGDRDDDRSDDRGDR